MSVLLRVVRNTTDKHSFKNIMSIMKHATPAMSMTSRTPRCQFCTTQLSQKAVPENFDPEQPVKFSTSKAQTWRSIDGFSLSKKILNRPSYQPYIVSLSMAVFLIYFCFLRESNDLDEEIGKSLYEKIPSLEEQNLRASIEYEHMQGRSTDQLKKRLEDISSGKDSN